MPPSQVGPRAAGGARSSPAHEAPPVDLYEHLLQVCLLLLLQETSATCPELRHALRPLGFEQTAATLTGVLERLAAQGLITVGPEPPAAHAAVAVYALTPEGRGWLRSATADLRRTEAVLGGFLARCGERFVSHA